MPGDALLFRRLSGSTIGAVRFHGRVRDGIGWGTDAMVTKQWRRRVTVLIDAFNIGRIGLYRPQRSPCRTGVDGGIQQARTELLGPVSFMRYRTYTPGLST